MEEFKALDALCEPDPRMTGWLTKDSTGKDAGVTVAHHHEWLARENLGEGVPEYIRDHFATAKNLLLYSWFVYRFIPVAQLHLYSCLEFAFRDRLGLNNEKPPALRRLILLAQSAGLLDGVTIRERRAPHFHKLRDDDPAATDAVWFFNHMASYIGYFRNNLAHGAITLMPDGGRSLRVVRDVVSHLYERRAVT
jgi:hypothetical protein